MSINISDVTIYDKTLQHNTNMLIVPKIAGSLQASNAISCLLFSHCACMLADFKEHCHVRFASNVDKNNKSQMYLVCNENFVNNAF